MIVNNQKDKYLSKPSEYLLFLNSLKIAIEFEEIIQIDSHHSQSMIGWFGISSLICLNNQGEIYDLDIRYAWGTEIFRQNLVDYGWDEITLLHKKNPNESNRHKLIIYLCEASTKLSYQQKLEQVAEQFVITPYWKTIHHLYLHLPVAHPFVLPNISELPVYQVAQEYLSNIDSLSTENKEKHIEKVLFLPPNSNRKAEGGLRTKGKFKFPSATDGLLSVITVVFNGDKYIEQAIQSVINQSRKNLEYIIIDGSSNDRTVDIIKKYEDYIDYWVSEPDRGLYHAMNKGIRVSHGTHILFINSDDLVFNWQSLDIRLNKVNILRSILIYLQKDDVVVKRIPGKINKDENSNIVRCPVGHQGFIGMNKSTDTFDENYKLIADRLLMYRKLNKEPSEINKIVIAISRDGGISSENNFAILSEIMHRLFLDSSIKSWLYFIQLWLYCFFREIAKMVGLVKMKRKYF